MIKNIIFFLSISCYFCFAQSGSTSPFSYAGLGDINFRGTQVTRFMGGIDVFSDSIHANLNNPASYGDLKLTTYSLGIHYKSNLMMSQDDKEYKAIAALDYLAVGIPAGKFGFGFGIIPYSSVGYRIESINNDDQGVSIFNNYQGSGGLNKAFLSVGFPFLKYFTSGITVNYGFGTLLYRTSQFKENVNLGTFLSNSSSLSGLNYQVSINSKIPIKKEYFFRLMYSFQPSSDFNSRNERIIYTQDIGGTRISDYEEVNLNTIGMSETKLSLSEKIKYGFGFGKSKKWFIGVQQNSINSAIFGSEFMEKDNIKYSSGTQFSIGGFYLPNFSSLTSYWKRIVYRFGYRRENTGLVFNSFPLKETAFSFGVGLPMAGFSNTNIGFEVGTRGEKSKSFVQENFFAFRIGFSLNDKWFIKRKYN